MNFSRLEICPPRNTHTHTCGISLLHMYIFKENKHYRAYLQLSDFSPCNSFFSVSGRMSSTTPYMCLLPGLKTVKGRGCRQKREGRPRRVARDLADLAGRGLCRRQPASLSRVQQFDDSGYATHSSTSPDVTRGRQQLSAFQTIRNSVPNAREREYISRLFLVGLSLYV